MITDEEIIAWFRRRTTNIFNERDVELSGDMYSIMPVEFFLAWTIQAKSMVEIGTADGSSLIPLLKVAQETGGMVHSVDPSPHCQDAFRLVRDYGGAGHWRFYNMKSDEFFKDYSYGIDFALIDGDHTWYQVARDIENCIQRLAPNGIILLTDLMGLPEQWFGDFDMKKRGYTEDCICGINKACSIVLPRYPEFTYSRIVDIFNPYLIITRAIGNTTPIQCEKRLPEVVYEE